MPKKILVKILLIVTLLLATLVVSFFDVSKLAINFDRDEKDTIEFMFTVKIRPLEKR